MPHLKALERSLAMEQKPVVIVMIALMDLFVPDWNPRKYKDEVKLLALMAYLENGGWVPRPLVWKGNGKVPLAIIAGQMRTEAYRRLGRTHIEVEILDITLEEAKNMANSSNEKADLFWLDRYEGWESRKQEEVWDLSTLAVKMGVSDTETSRAIRILRSPFPPNDPGDPASQGCSKRA
jgi:ParB-like chromosome segregation protein Spo0J